MQPNNKSIKYTIKMIKLTSVNLKINLFAIHINLDSNIQQNVN